MHAQQTNTYYSIYTFYNTVYRIQISSLIEPLHSSIHTTQHNTTCELGTPILARMTSCSTFRAFPLPLVALFFIICRPPLAYTRTRTHIVRPSPCSPFALTAFDIDYHASCASILFMFTPPIRPPRSPSATPYTLHIGGAEFIFCVHRRRRRSCFCFVHAAQRCFYPKCYFATRNSVFMCYALHPYTIHIRCICILSVCDIGRAAAAFRCTSSP